MYTPWSLHNVNKSVLIVTCCLNVYRREPLSVYAISCIINRFLDWAVSAVDCTNTLGGSMSIVETADQFLYSLFVIR